MAEHLQLLVVAALVGSGLVTGLLFAFSLMIMRALQEFPPATGMAVMQRINVLILNPLFLTLFMGTTLLSVGIAVVAVRGLPSHGALALLVGAAAYLVGPFGVTMAFNVPLNNRLAAAAPSEAASVWPAYVAAWLRWNHVRTAIGAVGIAALGWGLAAAARGA
jgi:uncharacterized membrane protein